MNDSSSAEAEIPESGHQGPSSSVMLGLFWLVALGLYWFLAVSPLSEGRHNNDFRHIYLGARALMAGMSPYPAPTLLEMANRTGMGGVSLNPYVYLPFTGLVLEPLARLTFPQASQSWFWINHGLTLGTIVLVILTLPAGARRWWIGAGLLAVFSVFHPLHRTLTAGQLNMVVTLAFLLVPALLAAKKPISAGVIAAFAMLFKLTPGLLLVPLLFVGGAPALMAFGAAAAVGLLWSLWRVGFKIHFDFLPMLASMGHGRSSWQEHGAIFWKEPTNQSFNSLLTHLLVAENDVTLPWVAGPAWIANLLSLGLSLAALALLVAIAIKWSKAAPTMTPVEASQSVMGLGHFTSLIALLIPALLWDHYLVAALPPSTYLLWHSIEQRRWGRVWGLGFCVFIMALPWPYGIPPFRSGLGIPLMSVKLWPLLVVVWMLLTVLNEHRILAANRAKDQDSVDTGSLDGLKSVR